MIRQIVLAHLRDLRGDLLALQIGAGLRIRLVEERECLGKGGVRALRVLGGRIGRASLVAGGGQFRPLLREHGCLRGDVLVEAGERVLLDAVEEAFARGSVGDDWGEDGKGGDLS